MNITVRDNGNKAHPLDKIRGEVENVFERLAQNWQDFESSVSEHLPEWIPSIRKPKADASQADNVLEFSVELPGLDSDDIEVSLQDGALVIEAEKESESEEKQRNYYLRERTSQKYYRSFSLPSDVQESKITATCKNGLLAIRIPRKSSKKTEVRKVKVASGK